MKKLSNKQARSRVDLTQKQLASLAGVSRSTVQRAEKSGTTKNKKLNKVYENIEKNRSISKEFKQLRRSVLSRLDKLEAQGLEKTPAYRNIDGNVPTPEDLARDPAYAKRKLAKMKEFLDYQTSTVKGAKEWLKNVSSAAEKTSGLDEDSTEDDQDVFWDVFNTIKNDRSFSKYWKRGQFLSGQAESDIREIINSNIINGDKTTFDSVIEELRELENSYNRNIRGRY